MVKRHTWSDIKALERSQRLAQGSRPRVASLRASTQAPTKVPQHPICEATAEVFGRSPTRARSELSFRRGRVFRPFRGSLFGIADAARGAATKRGGCRPRIGPSEPLNSSFTRHVVPVSGPPSDWRRASCRVSTRRRSRGALCRAPTSRVNLRQWSRGVSNPPVFARPPSRTRSGVAHAPLVTAVVGVQIPRTKSSAAR